MIKNIVLLVISLSPSFLFSQNLVPNWSFEEVDCQMEEPTIFGCPIYRNSPWTQPTLGTSDSFNACHLDGTGDWTVPDNFTGNQDPYNASDQGYAGIITYSVQGQVEYREYLKVLLTEPLIAGETYIIGFKCSLADNSRYAADGLGMHLSPLPVATAGTGAISATPQLYTGVEDNMEFWSNYEQEFVAEGGERFVTIGNFFTDENTTAVLLGQSGYHRSYYYIDEVKVIPLANGVHSLDNAPELFTLAPNPTKDVFRITLDDTRDRIIQLFDQAGKEVTALVAINILSDKEISVDIGQLANGMYLVKTELGYRRILKRDND